MTLRAAAAVNSSSGGSKSDAEVEATPISVAAAGPKTLDLNMSRAFDCKKDWLMLSCCSTSSLPLLRLSLRKSASGKDCILR